MFDDFTSYAKVASMAPPHDMQVQQKQQVQQVQKPQQQQVQQQQQQQQQQQVQQMKVQQMQQQRQDDVDETELDDVSNKRQHGSEEHKSQQRQSPRGRGGSAYHRGRSRDIFIYRVHPDTSKRDIEDGIRGRNFEVRDLVCISSEQSMFKSFKLTVPVSQLSSLLTDEVPWPEGVKVRRFFPSRRDQASTKL